MKIFTLIAASGIVFFLSQESISRPLTCPTQPDVTVISENALAAHIVCSHSEKAISVLSRFGLFPKRQITVKIVEDEIGSRGYMAYGTYNSRSDIIELMSYQAILRHYKEPTMYEEFFDHIHYGGAVAHEIAHAVFHHNSLNMSPGTAHQEYLAHAVQLASLPENKRNDIIAEMNVSAWESGDAISDVYMALEPTKFAVKSYKHLTTLKEPGKFIDILLNSKWFYVYIP